MPSLKEQWEATPLWQRLVVAVVLPLIVMGAIWFYVVSPDMEQKERLIKDRERLKQEIAKYKKLIRPGALKPLEEQLQKLKEEEKQKREELERVVGKLPRLGEIEKVFGEINLIAASRDIIITRISLSQPRVINLQLVESGGKKFVKAVAQQEPRSRGRQRGVKRKQAKKKVVSGVPITTMEVSLNLEGKTRDIYSFLKAVYKKGIVSYPKSVSIKPIKGEGMVSANVVIDVILQK